MKEIREELLEIGYKYVGKFITNETVEAITNDYNKLFEKYDLLDFKWKLEISENNNSIIITPIRTIDKYILKAILAE